tara:strand:- start:1664 stop:1867 length:204 start_codon:yes stop_codon:yes gene_type:complete
MRQYLGESELSEHYVYAEWQEPNMLITIESKSEKDPSNSIALKPPVLQALMDFLQKIAEDYKERNSK